MTCSKIYPLACLPTMQSLGIVLAMMQRIQQKKNQNGEPQIFLNSIFQSNMTKGWNVLGKCLVSKKAQTALTPETLNLLKCQSCKQSQVKKDAEWWVAEVEAMGQEYTILEEDLTSTHDPATDLSSDWCCLYWVLSLQEDFINEKPMIQHHVVGQGHVCNFLTKFHCELNPIIVFCVQPFPYHFFTLKCTSHFRNILL